MPEANIGRGGAGSAKSVRVSRRRVRAPRVVVAAPRGDIASSGGDYGMKQAHRAERSAPVKRAQRAAYKSAPVAQRKAIVKHAQGSVKANLAPVHAGRQRYARQLEKSAATKDTKGATDRARAQAFLSAHPEILKRTDGKKGSHLASITAGVHLGKLAGKALSSVPKLLSNLGALHLATAGKGGHSGGSAADAAGKFGANAAKDTMDLAVNTPANLVKLGVDTAHDASHIYHKPGDAPKVIWHRTRQYAIDPYTNLLKHPDYALTHPVTTALMVAPVGKVPFTAAGKVARVAGKQTLERPAAELAGTTIKHQRIGSKNIVVRARQAKKDKAKPGAPTISEKELHRRADYVYAEEKARAHRASAEAHKETMRRTKGSGAPKKQRKAQAQYASDQVYAHTRAERHHRMAAEFGANVRPSVGVAEKQVTQAARDAAAAQLEHAKAHAETAHTAHREAMTNAQKAAARSRRSPILQKLENDRAVARRELDRRKKTADAEYRGAHEGATKAQGRGPKSLAVTKLERDLRRAQSELRAARSAHVEAKAALGEAEGRAQVLSRNVGGAAGERRAAATRTAGEAPKYAAGAHGVSTAGEGAKARALALSEAESRVKQIQTNLAVARSRRAGVPPAQHDILLNAIARRESHHPQRIRDARQAISDLDKQIAAERARIKGVPPKEHDALLAAIADKGHTQTNLHLARAEEAARIAENQQMLHVARRSGLTDPAAQGRVFAHEDDANKVSKMVPFKNTVVKLGEDQYAVVPHAIHDRLTRQSKIGTKDANMARFLRASSRSFRGSVLPFSGKWLFGQAGEAGLRTMVQHGGNPVGVGMSLARVRKVVKRMNNDVPGSGDEFLTRSLPGGKYDPSAPLRSGLSNKKTWADEFKGSALEPGAKMLTKSGALPGVRHTRQVFGKYQAAVMDTVNGAIENTAQKAMLGKTIAQHPVMERRILTLGDKAIEDAAQGLKGTHAQVELGRSVLRAYGNYTKFGPDMREMLIHNTPFVPWYLNMAKFLLQVMPVDHPVQSALMASTSQALEDWRIKNRISFQNKKMVPPFLLGNYPLGDNKFQTVGRYTPFLPNNPVGALAQSLWPQLSGGQLPLAPGVDWKGHEIKSDDPRLLELAHVREAITNVLEAHIPGSGLALRASGLDAALRGDKKGRKKVRQRSTLTNVKRSLSPFTPLESKTGSGGGGTGLDLPTTDLPNIELPDLPNIN